MTTLAEYFPALAEYFPALDKLPDYCWSLTVSDAAKGAGSGVLFPIKEMFDLRYRYYQRQLGETGRITASIYGQTLTWEDGEIGPKRIDLWRAEDGSEVTLQEFVQRLKERHGVQPIVPDSRGTP